MLIKTPLGFTDFTDDDLAANADSELTPEQIARLITEIETQVRAGIVQRHWIALAAMILILAGCVISWLMNTAMNITDAQLLLFVISILGIFGVAANLAFPPETANPTLDRLRAFNFEIAGYGGPAEFVIIPSYTRLGKYQDNYLVRTEAGSFTVTRELWEDLRNSSNHVRLYYLTYPLVTLLSVEPIMLPSRPPTDAELANVIGIGDDGELIYEEQDEPGNRRDAAGKE